MTSGNSNQIAGEQTGAGSDADPRIQRRPYDPDEERDDIIRRVKSRLHDLRLPTWREQPGPGDLKAYKPDDFDSHRAQLLRSNWSELEMNLRSVFTHYARPAEAWFDARSAEELIDILDHSLSALESTSPNLAVVDDDLGRARRLFVWLIPPAWVGAQCQAVGARLKASDDEKAKSFNMVATGEDRRYELDDAIGVLNEVSSAWAANSGLQKRHLTNLGIGAFVVLVAELALAPILVSRTTLTAWGYAPMGNMVGLAYLTTLGIAVIGAAGALLSAFLQRRDKPVGLRDYQVRETEAWGRAAVGAMIAVLAYFLLSFNVMPGMSATSPGTYLLVAFIAGFSERYFVGLLSVDKVGSDRPPTPMTLSGPPPMTESSAKPQHQR